MNDAKCHTKDSLTKGVTAPAYITQSARWPWGEDVIHGDMMTLLHRVVFYGDYQKQLEDLAVLLGVNLVEEGGVA